MNTALYEDFIRPLGDEYPAAIKIGGTRITLAYETRFKRHYIEKKSELETHHTDVSRFIDGTASITLQQLKEEWSSWTEADRADFCDSMLDLVNLDHPDFADIVRFLLQNADVNILGPLVLQLPVLETFPRDETFELLIGVLQRSSLGHTSNIVRALGLTQHPQAETTLRRHLQSIVETPAAWKDADFHNYLAKDAAYCVLSLLKLGVPPNELEGIVRRLSDHACARNREWCRRNFAKDYSWLKS